MTDVDKCPELKTFELLLTGALSEREEDRLAKHFDGCTTCRRRLDEATERPSLGLEMLNEGNPAIRVEELELAKKIKQESLWVKPKPDLAKPRSEVDEITSLEFLGPSGTGKSLGRLGPYEITEIIGRGGMGVVLCAQDRKLNRVVAIKVLAPELAANATARRRFLREAQAAAAVSHEHLVTIHAVDETANPPYLVMEYVHGRSLQQRIDEEGPLGLHEILRIGIQVARGLAEAHAQGLVHRDVKPANIMLENGVERAKITDFGLARAVNDMNVTRSGEVTGTPLYMSPEQALGQRVDLRSDLFSLGSVMYAMCVGRPPFRADCSVGVLRRVCDDQPRPIREVNPEIPDWLAAVVHRLLAKVPERRVQSADEVADHLGKHLHALQNPGANHAAIESEHDHTGQALAAGSGRGRSWRLWLLVASAVIAPLVALGTTEATGVTQVSEFVATVLRIRTPEGTLVVEVDDPNVQVAIEGGGGLTITGAGPQEVRLEPGRYWLKAAKDGQPIHRELVSIERGGREVVTLRLDKEALAASPDNREAIVAEIFREVRRFEGHQDGVDTVAFSPDGKLAASGGGLEIANDDFKGADFAIRLWEVESGRLLRKLNGHSHRVTSVAFSPDRELLASGGLDNTIRFWDVGTGEQIRQCTTLNGITSLAFLPEGDTLVSAGESHLVRLWDVRSAAELFRFEGHRFPVYTAAVSPDGRYAVSAGRNQQQEQSTHIRIWDLEKREPAGGLSGHTAKIMHVDFLPDGGRILSLGWDKTVRVWDRRTKRELWRWDLPHVGVCAAISPDGRHLVTGHPGGATNDILLWNIQTRQFIGRFLGHDHTVRGVGISPDGHYVLSASLDQTVRLWRLPESAWPDAASSTDTLHNRRVTSNARDNKKAGR